MQIRPGVDLGYAFNKFKTQLQAVTAAKKESGEDYALNFGRLQGASKALLSECCPSPAASEAPTLLLYDKLNFDWEEKNDIPLPLFTKSGLYENDENK